MDGHLPPPCGILQLYMDCLHCSDEFIVQLDWLLSCLLVVVKTCLASKERNFNTTALQGMLPTRLTSIQLQGMLPTRLGLATSSGDFRESDINKHCHWLLSCLLA